MAVSAPHITLHPDLPYTYAHNIRVILMLIHGHMRRSIGGTFNNLHTETALMGVLLLLLQDLNNLPVAPARYLLLRHH